MTDNDNTPAPTEPTGERKPFWLYIGGALTQCFTNEAEAIARANEIHTLTGLWSGVEDRNVVTAIPCEAFVFTDTLPALMKAVAAAFEQAHKGMK
jgi:hypothetical protein